MLSMNVCVYTDTAKMCLHARFAQILTRSLLLFSPKNSDIPVPLYFPNLSFPIQILYYIGYSLFLFSSKTIPLSLADWQLCVHASLSPSQSLSVAIACGRPQSHSIRNDFGFRRATRFCLLQVRRTLYAPNRWISCSSHLELQTCKIRYLGLISSFDLACGSQGIMRERVLLIMFLFLVAEVIEASKLFG